MVSAFSPKIAIENQHFMQKINGKSGIYFFAVIGILLHLSYPLSIRAEIMFWLGIICSCLGACYTGLKIYVEFIKRNNRGGSHNTDEKKN